MAKRSNKSGVTVTCTNGRMVIRATGAAALKLLTDMAQPAENAQRSAPSTPVTSAERKTNAEAS